MTNLTLAIRDREALLLKARINHRISEPLNIHDVYGIDDLDDYWISEDGERIFYTLLENHYRQLARVYMDDPLYEEDGL
jgi:hypothetical protein